jgi:hypothetical protein
LLGIDAPRGHPLRIEDKAAAPELGKRNILSGNFPLTRRLEHTPALAIR